jgi:hypothetical protein
MAETWAHKKDTEKAVGTTLSREKVETLKDVVHLVIDGQATENEKRGCRELISRLEKYGITADGLCRQFLKQGGEPQAIEKYNGDKQQFLVDWLLPPYGPAHQVYTHKGADYDYSKENDKDYWSALEVQQSWLLKKYLLTKFVENIYSLSSADAEKVAMTLYSVHRLRDLQYNGSDETPPKKKEYLFNVVQDMEKYTLPLIRNTGL